MSEQDKSKTVKVTATPEWLAEQAVTGDGDGNVWLRWPNGIHLARVLRTNVHTESTAFLSTYGVFGQTMRRWFVQHMESAYLAGIEAGRKQSLGDCQTWPPEVAAALRNAEGMTGDLAAAIDVATPARWEALVEEAKRLKANDANLVAEVAKARQAEARIVRAEIYTDIGNALGLVRENNDYDEALVIAEFERLRKVAADAEKKATPDDVAKARAEGEKAGRDNILSAFIVEHNHHVETAAVEARRASDLRRQAEEADKEVQTQRRTAELYATIIKTLRPMVEDK